MKTECNLCGAREHTVDSIETRCIVCMKGTMKEVDKNRDDQPKYAICGYRK